MLLKSSLSFLTSLAFVTAQYDSPEDIPLCAYSPIQDIINNAGCQVTETSCFCSKPNIVPAFASAVVAACDGTVNSAQVSSFASSFCVITGSPTATAQVSSGSEPQTTAEITTTTDDINLSDTPATISITTSATSMPGFNLTTAIFPSTTKTGAMNGTSQTSSGASATPTDESRGTTNLGVSALALAIAIGGLTWIFAEL